MEILRLSDTRSRLRPVTRLYALIVVVWFSFVVILISFIFSSEIEKNRDRFQRSADALYEQLSNIVEINESVIEGFASLLATRQDHEWMQVRSYARQMLERYPHIYNFEVAQQVSSSELPGFINDMRKRLDSNFRIASFDFSDRRQWMNVGQRDYYYPIIFIEPIYSDNRAILGLDLGSNTLFHDAMKRSARLNTPVASQPFTLLEGQRGFLLHREVSRNGEAGISEQFAVLVIKIRKFLPAKLLNNNRLEVRLLIRGYDGNVNDTELYYKAGQRAEKLETMLLPILQYRRDINNTGQPFVISLERQLRFSDINMALVMAIVVIALVSFWVVLVFSRMHHHYEMERLQYENRLYEMANNDSLTGLANRNFLVDRMRQVLAKAKRKGSRFAIVFMDMNNFKMVNDEFGHAAGDSLLRDIAIRFRECMREEDTVSRYQGDEFVILLEEVNNTKEADPIRLKLKQCLAEPFWVDGQQVSVSVSVGVATFPDDGGSIDTLFEVADRRMYEEKKAGPQVAGTDD